ncbi:hypothetical protein SEA_KABOCHA_70 [Gordonia phage Kabocha]|uniref:Uncharacterized protein n=1 Tax=Gordonia phage Chidiebere TaxID=2656530 RepID=A0A649VKN6_9CAUD|nr:hypothetical protein PQD14_gp069 [Gordonia phage Chidiebere]QGJ92960.1 hypothetical protein PBI_CHIDIEBERE_69 [Gordonia phage Chidiebere]WAA19856.1 hypothetical protein SEA_KABOCHA_70 [Gordonia phage Kabocha]WAA20045.1 hypothetical protein SEA_HANEM_68 [Gordonia phage Hanem]
MAETTKKKPVRRKRSPRAGADAGTRGSTSTTGTTTSTPKKKASTKKSPVKKPAPKKVAPKKSTAGVVREKTPEGFIVGGDSAIIAAALVEGGADRHEINENIRKAIKKANGLTTRNGEEKYIPSMVSSILAKMLATGYYDIQSEWKLVKLDRKKRVRKPAKKAAS